MKFILYSSKMGAIIMTIVLEYHPILMKQLFSYRSHFGEINEPFLCVSRYALLNNWQVCQVHAEVGNAGRVTSTRSMFNKLLFSEFVFCKKKYAHGKRCSFGALTRILFIQSVLPVQSISHVLKSSIGRH